MPVLRLSVVDLARPSAVALPGGGTLDVPLLRLPCVLDLPGLAGPVNGVIDTGAPLTFIPKDIWNRLGHGVDYEWLPYLPGAVRPTARVAGWSFAYRLARFLAPVVVMDYSTAVDRPAVVAAFADGDPPGATPGTSKVVVGLWGGLLEEGRLDLGRDPATARPTAHLAFP